MRLSTNHTQGTSIQTVNLDLAVGGAGSLIARA